MRKSDRGETRSTDERDEERKMKKGKAGKSVRDEGNEDENWVQDR